MVSAVPSLKEVPDTAHSQDCLADYEETLYGFLTKTDETVALRPWIGYTVSARTANKETLVRTSVQRLLIPGQIEDARGKGRRRPWLSVGVPVHILFWTLILHNIWPLLAGRTLLPLPTARRPR